MVKKNKHTSPNIAPTLFAQISYVGLSSIPKHILCNALTASLNTEKGRSFAAFMSGH